MEKIQLNPPGSHLLPGKNKPPDMKGIDDVATPFFDFLKEKLSDVNQTLKKSEEMDMKLASGEAESIHEVMIAAQKAKTAMNMTMTIRGLLLRTYQDLLRMQ